MLDGGSAKPVAYALDVDVVLHMIKDTQEKKKKLHEKNCSGPRRAWSTSDVQC